MQMRLTRKQINMIVVAVGGVLILALLIVVVRNVTQSRKVRVIEKAAIEESARKIANVDEICAGAQDKERCVNALVNEEVQRHGSAELCRALEGADLENCVRLVAQSSLDREDCSVLSGGAKGRCMDDVVFRVAKRDLNVDMCDQIGDERKTRICKSGITGEIVAKGECEQYGLSAELCNIEDIVDRAVANADTGTCNQIEDTEKSEECVELVNDALGEDQDDDGLSLKSERSLGTDPMNEDTDSDGLSDRQEVGEYGTDPLNPDSDGDGFLDGEEVRNGYNPLGEGTL